MNLSQVKLVVTDMDGTLLNSQGQVSDTFFNLYKELKALGVHFVAASGRQYHSIVNKLAPIKDDITIIAENGGIAKYQDQKLFSNYFPQQEANKFIAFLRTIDDTYIVLCGENRAYIETQDEDFIMMFNEYYNKFSIVDDLTKVTNDNFFKIAVYSFGGSETTTYPHLKAYDNVVQIKVSGKHWLDLSHLNTNKGHALNQIQERLEITKDETLVFGDYNNDLEMLEQAHFSFAMKNAHPNVKQIANFETKSNDEQGVEHILKQLITQKKLVAKDR